MDTTTTTEGAKPTLAVVNGGADTSAAPARDEAQILKLHPPPAGWFAKVLPSGAVAHMMEKPKGKHLRQAQRMAGNDQASLTYAIVAVIATVDGRSLNLDEVLELDLHDVTTLLHMFNVGKGDSSPKGT